MAVCGYFADVVRSDRLHVVDDLKVLCPAIRDVLAGHGRFGQARLSAAFTVPHVVRDRRDFRARVLRKLPCRIRHHLNVDAQLVLRFGVLAGVARRLVIDDDDVLRVALVDKIDYPREVDAGAQLAGVLPLGDDSVLRPRAVRDKQTCERVRRVGLAVALVVALDLVMDHRPEFKRR